MPEKSQPNCLVEARQIAQALRFSGDSLKSIEGVFGSLGELRNEFNRDGIKVTEGILPAVYRHFRQACDRLKIPAGSVEAFVYASPELQAVCYMGNNSECIVRISSALIELLDGEELEFVVGHELGHFLLEHASARAHIEKSVELFRFQRAQEFSADRIGLIACGSIDIAARALMKTVSGLGEKHLRFNISEFVSQIKNLRDSNSSSGLASTHPSFLMRCRALLWFSTTKTCLDKSFAGKREDLLEIDKRITDDMIKDIDGRANRLVSEAIVNVQFWLAALSIVESMSFGKKAQEGFAKLFGDSACEKLKSFLGGFSPEEARREVEIRLRTAIGDLRLLIPLSIDEEIAKAKEAISHFAA